MLKILILGLHGILGGSETYVNNLIRCFDANKINCDFLVVGEKKTPYEDEINAFYNDNKNHFFHCPNLKLKYMEGKKWLKNFYEINHYDLIYLNATSAANVIYCKYAIDKQKTPLITHSHFSNGPWVNHVLFRPYTRKHSKYKLACAEPSAKWMFGNHIEDVVFIPNGIDINRFRFDEEKRKKVRTQLNISDELIVLGHVGRFSQEKNQMFLVELCKQLSSKFMFICIGDGPLKKNVETEIERQGVSNRFIILPVSHSVEEYYCAMDAFVMPSLYEGLPIVTVEAQCAGLPLILSDTISKEADLSGKSIFAKLNDVSAWKSKIDTMNFNRYEGTTYVIEKGFSIKDAALKVEQMIIDACKEK